MHESFKRAVTICIICTRDEGPMQTKITCTRASWSFSWCIAIVIRWTYHGMMHAASDICPGHLMDMVHLICRIPMEVHPAQARHHRAHCHRRHRPPDPLGPPPAPAPEVAPAAPIPLLIPPTHANSRSDPEPEMNSVHAVKPSMGRLEPGRHFCDECIMASMFGFCIQIGNPTGRLC